MAAVYERLSRDDPRAAAALAQPLAEAGNHEAQFVLGVLKDVGAGIALNHDEARTLVEHAAAEVPAAALYLAWRFSSGFGSEKPDAAAAASWQQQAGPAVAELNPVLAKWVEPRDHRLTPNFSRAFLWMLNSAADGDVVAQSNLAIVYLEPYWTKPDAGQHVRWLREAANRHDAAAALRLAGYYDTGLFVAQDPAAAQELRRVAAEAGSADAQFALGEQYRTGDGVPVDLTVAEKWLRLAAAQDHVQALVKLSELLGANVSGHTPDYTTALRMARRAAELGSVEGINDVAGMLRAGQGAPQDRAAAAKLYEEAAQKGSDYAADMRGWMQLQGELGPIDHADAIHWFEQAAARRNSHAMRQLGILYRDGTGVPKSPAKAFEWLERAAREGDAWSQNQVGWMLRQGIGIAQDDEEAVNWFRLAAKNGEPLGDANLGFHYLYGRGVPKDVVEAARHLGAAARLSADPWISHNLNHAAIFSSAADRTALRHLLDEWVTAPDLMQSPGILPELCLTLLEGLFNTGPKNEAAAQLLSKMVASRRPQSRLVVAQHAFTGRNMPFDLAVARAFARDAAEGDPRSSAAMLAVIDSVAAETPEARAAAGKALRELAESGQQTAALTLANRILNGLEGETDLPLAEKYLRATLSDSADQPSVEQMVAYFQGVVPVAPTEEEIAAKLAKIVAARVDPNNAPPKPVWLPQPAYPAELRASGFEGSAEVLFVVDANGRTADVHCSASSHPLFAQSAEASVRHWRFAPAMKGGKAVRAKVQQSLVFNLQTEDHSPAVYPGKKS